MSKFTFIINYKVYALHDCDALPGYPCAYTFDLTEPGKVILNISPYKLQFQEFRSYSLLQSTTGHIVIFRSINYMPLYIPLTKSSIFLSHNSFYELLKQQFNIDIRRETPTGTKIRVDDKQVVIYDKFTLIKPITHTIEIGYLQSIKLNDFLPQLRKMSIITKLSLTPRGIQTTYITYQHTTETTILNLQTIDAAYLLCSMFNISITHQPLLPTKSLFELTKQTIRNNTLLLIRDKTQDQLIKLKTITCDACVEKIHNLNIFSETPCETHNLAPIPLEKIINLAKTNATIFKTTENVFWIDQPIFHNRDWVYYNNVLIKKDIQIFKYHT